MTRRAVLAAAAVAAALTATPAAAQEPVVGAGSFTTAPIIEPGTYRDTVLPEEYLYYAVRVGPGQRLHVTADAGRDPRELADLGLAYVQVNLHAPDRSTIYGLEGSSSTAGSGAAPADVATDPAKTVAEAAASTTGEWVGPGVYFIAIYAVFVGSGELTKAEIPVEFTVAVEGQAQSEPSPSPTPSPSPAPSATAAPPDDVEEDSSPMIAAGAGIGGLLFGVVGGIVLRQRRR